MHFKIILLWSALVLINPVETILTRGPSDVFATRGSSVILPCYTDLSKAVMWQVEKVGDSVEVLWYDIYQGIPGHIKSSFQARFNVSVDSTDNQYNLTITDVQMEDAGTYRCGDESGLGLQKYKQGIPNYGATAELAIGGNFVCFQNIEDNHTIGLNEGSLERPPDLIRMNCSLHYRGNISPNLRWILLWNNEREESLEDFAQSWIETNGTDSILISTMKIPAQRRMNRGFVRCILETPNVDQVNSGIDDDMVWNSSVIAIQVSDICECTGLVTGIAACLVVISLLIIGLLFIGLLLCKKKTAKRSPDPEKSGGEESKTSDVLLGKREKIILTLGLDTGSKVEQKVCRISLGKPDTIDFFNLNREINGPAEIWSDSAACVVSNVLYAVGIGAGRNQLWKSSVNKENIKWTRCADMSPSEYGRRRHCVTTVDDKIYVLGGWNDTNEATLDSILCYDIKSDEWSGAGQLSYAVMFAACVTYDHFIYVFGGADERNTQVNYVQVYNTATSKVVLSSNPMPAAHSLMRAVLYGSKALLVGERTCYVYDFESSDNWSERKRFKTDVRHFGLTLDDNTLYVVGGGTNSTGPRWTFYDDVKSLLVGDFLLDNREAEWKHHARLPIPALVNAYTTEALLI